MYQTLKVCVVNCVNGNYRFWGDLEKITINWNKRSIWGKDKSLFTKQQKQNKSIFSLGYTGWHKVIWTTWLSPKNWTKISVEFVYNHIPDCPTMENLILGVRWSPAPSCPDSKETFFTIIAHLPWDQCWSFQFSSNKLFMLRKGWSNVSDQPLPGEDFWPFQTVLQLSVSASLKYQLWGAQHAASVYFCRLWFCFM